MVSFSMNSFVAEMNFMMVNFSLMKTLSINYGKNYQTFDNLINNGLTSKSALPKLQLLEIPLAEAERHCLRKLFQGKIADFQKLSAVEFQRDCPSFNGYSVYIANICLHKSIKANFYSFTDIDKHLLQKICKHKVGGPSRVFLNKYSYSGR